MLAIGTGGVIAATSATTDDAQLQNGIEDSDRETPTEADDEASVGDENNDEYDEKLTAGEHVELQPSILSFLGDGTVGIEFQEPTQRDLSTGTATDGTISADTDRTKNATGTEYDGNRTVDESFTLNLSEEDIEVDVVDSDNEYDEKLTADEHIELQPSVISFEGDGFVDIELQEPTQKDVAIDSSGDNGSVTVSAEEN